MSKKKIIIAFAIVFLVGFCFIKISSADIAIRTVTKVYFEKDGMSYNQPVSFTVNCYGYSYSPGPEVEKKFYIPKKVFSFFADCPNYGCEIYENYYLNYRHIDYCNLEGKTQGYSFKIKKFATSPLPENCNNINDTLLGGRECELKFDLTNVSFNQNKGFFKAIICFFKGLFGGGC